jgi:four helix bundle protein
MDLMLAVYRATESFPKHETYGLTQQLRRCVVSVPSNIAEGSSRRSTQEFLRFLNISCGSLAEAETQVTAARMLDYIDETAEKSLLDQAGEVSRILHGLYQSLQEKSSTH